jgi:hypothetical protein
MQPAPTTVEPYTVSATYLAGTIGYMKEAGLLTDAFLGKLPAELRELVANPFGKSWWDGRFVEPLGQAVVATYGNDIAEEVYFQTTLKGVGPIVRPLVSVVSAMFGLNPGTLFSRIGELARATVRGVTAKYQSLGPNEGIISVTYPPPLNRVVLEQVWRGTVRCIFGFTKADGRVLDVKVEGSTLLLHLSWQKT